MTAVDTITPAFIEMVKEQTPDVLDVVYRSTERHRLIGGKNARLLHKGDIVALRDLHQDRTDVPGVTAVVGTYTTKTGTTFVITDGHGTFYIPSSRLVLVRRAAV